MRVKEKPRRTGASLRRGVAASEDRLAQLLAACASLFGGGRRRGAACVREDPRLLGREVERDRPDHARVAPVRAARSREHPARIGGDREAVALAPVGVVVADVEGEVLVGVGQPDVAVIVIGQPDAAELGRGGAEPIAPELGRDRKSFRQESEQPRGEIVLASPRPSCLDARRPWPERQSGGLWAERRDRTADREWSWRGWAPRSGVLARPSPVIALSGPAGAGHYRPD